MSSIPFSVSLGEKSPFLPILAGLKLFTNLMLIRLSHVFSSIFSIISRVVSVCYEWLVHIISFIPIRKTIKRLCQTTMGVLGLVLFIFCAILAAWFCFWIALALSISFRHFMLRGIPRPQSPVPLLLNTHPLATEIWRWDDVEPLLHLPSRLSSETLVEGKLNKGSSVATSLWTFKTSSPLSPTRLAIPSLWDHIWHTPPSNEKVITSADDAVDMTSSLPPSAISLVEASAGRLSETADQLRAELLRARFRSVLASSTVWLIPPPYDARYWRNLEGKSGRRSSSSNAASFSSIPKRDELHNDGEGGLGYPYQSIWNVEGTFQAEIQLIFLKEGLAGRSATIAVDSVLLLSQNPSEPQALSSLKPFARHVSGTSFTLGGGGNGLGPTSFISLVWWIWQDIKRFTITTLIGFPRFLYRSWNYYVNGRFDFPRTRDDCEIEVKIPLFQNFHPSLEWQKRFHALNLTIYRHHDIKEGEKEDGQSYLSSSASSPCRLIRASVRFTTKYKSSLIYYLLMWPSLSIIFLTVILWIGLVGVAWVLLLSIGIWIFHKTFQFKETEESSLSFYSPTSPQIASSSSLPPNPSSSPVLFSPFSIDISPDKELFPLQKDSFSQFERIPPIPSLDDLPLPPLSTSSVSSSFIEGELSYSSNPEPEDLGNIEIKEEEKETCITDESVRVPPQESTTITTFTSLAGSHNDSGDELGVKTHYRGFRKKD